MTVMVGNVRQLVLVGVVFAGLGGCDDATSECLFDPYVERYLDTGNRADLVDCGDLPGWVLGTQPDDRMWREARDCVLGAIAAGQPYVVTWEVPGIEGSDDVALIWLGEGRRPAKIYRGVTAEAKLTPPVRVECDQVADLGDCSDVVRSLCLSCQGPIVDRCGE